MIEPAIDLACRGCARDGCRRVVDLGLQPASDSFPRVDCPGPDDRRPLELWFCPGCSLVQLGPVAPVAEEPVLAVESATSRAHARAAAAGLLAEYPDLAGAPVREFVSHHGGSWSAALGEAGCPQAPAGATARLVLDVHALAHEPDLGAALADRARALALDGLLVLEFHHVLPLIQDVQYDTVRHGHWSYLSLTAVSRIAGGLGLVVVGARSEAVFGGSLRAVLAPAAADRPVDVAVTQVLDAEADAGLTTGSGLEAFARRAQRTARDLRDFLLAQRAAGRTVLGYGAPSKAAVLLGLGGVGPDLLPFTVDAAPMKHGRAVPGVRVPIRPPGDLLAARPDVVLLLTWDLADEVIAQLEAAGGWGARYALPLSLDRAVGPP